MSVDTVPVPKDLKEEEILLKIEAAGWCHTDLQVLEGVYKDAGTMPPMVGSHEPFGRIVAFGPKADRNGELKIGDRVGSINTFHPCMRCKACRQGKQLCEKMPGMLGLTLDGGFSEYMKASSRVVQKVPDEISAAEAAPLFCAGATTYGAIKAAEVEKGQWVANIGIGGLGHLGTQYLKALGCKVIAIDNRQEALDLANESPKHLRPDKTFLIDSEEAKEKCVDELSNGLYDSNPGVDRVIINTEQGDLVVFGQNITRKGGIIVDVGLPSDNKMTLSPFSLSFSEQTIKGRLICTPEECKEMLDLHAKNGCKTFVEKTYPVEQINDLIEHYKSKSLKGRLCITF